jgi:GNAT superfamily N-acetyltransferase
MKPIIRLLSPIEGRSVRGPVLRPEQPAVASTYPQDEAPDTLHVGAEMEGEIACVATIYPAAPPGETDLTAWRLVGMATRPDMQRHGCGRAVMERCVSCVAERGGTRLWCNSRLEAVGFYQRLGFVAFGEPFEVPGRGVRLRMEYRIASAHPKE